MKLAVLSYEIVRLLFCRANSYDFHAAVMQIRTADIQTLVAAGQFYRFSHLGFQTAFTTFLRRPCEHRTAAVWSQQIVLIHWDLPSIGLPFLSYESHGLYAARLKRLLYELYYCGNSLTRFSCFTSSCNSVSPPQRRMSFWSKQGRIIETTPGSTAELCHTGIQLSWGN